MASASVVAEDDVIKTALVAAAVDKDDICESSFFFAGGGAKSSEVVGVGHSVMSRDMEMSVMSSVVSRVIRWDILKQELANISYWLI